MELESVGFDPFPGFRQVLAACLIVAGQADREDQQESNLIDVSRYLHLPECTKVQAL
jgi:hypothetical protein